MPRGGCGGRRRHPGRHRLAAAGAVDWNSLLKQQNGFYEPGVFDVRSDPPRPTALASATAALATTGEFDHPVLDRAEREAGRCFRENTEGAALPAEACARHGVPDVSFPSDLVFNGALGRPYVESDAVDPRGVYGRSKAEAERRILAAHPQALVVRTSAFFGPWDIHNFAYATLHAVSRHAIARSPHGAGT